jgi:hypothetical protein
MGLSQIKHAIRLLPLTQLRKLDEWLHELISKAEEANHKERPLARKSSLAEQIIDNKTYRLEGVRCGKENCKCARGKPHGPYWYSYARVKDKVTSRYVGKRLPDEVEKKMRRPTKR